jgi:hypothetical protein
MAQVCEGRRVFCPYGFYSPALTRPRCRSPACPAVDCASRVLVCLELLDLTGRELALGVRLGPRWRSRPGSLLTGASGWTAAAADSADPADRHVLGALVRAALPRLTHTDYPFSVLEECPT